MSFHNQDLYLIHVCTCIMYALNVFVSTYLCELVEEFWDLC